MQYMTCVLRIYSGILSLTNAVYTYFEASNEAKL